MRRWLASLFVVLSVAAPLVRPAIVAAATAAASAEATASQALATTTVAPTAFSSERLRMEMARLLAAHFNVEGELQVELLRPWTPPAHPAAVWQLVVVEFPASATPMMAVRCRLLADGVPAEETSFTIRASLYRARHPADRLLPGPRRPSRHRRRPLLHLRPRHSGRPDADLA